MGEGPRRQRAKAWVYAALFGPDDCSDADTEVIDEEVPNSTLTRDQSEER
ncbi:hypothetical protein [Halobellus sp. EA9]